MKIHNYGNDYVQARKFKTVSNDRNRIAENEPTVTGEVQAEADTAKEETKTKKGGKKKISNNEDNI